MAFALCFGSSLRANESAAFKVQFKPSRMEKESGRYIVEVTASVEPNMSSSQESKIGVGLSSILQENDSFLNKEKLEVEFDKTVLSFKFKQSRSASMIEKQSGFSSCINRWINSQSSDIKGNFLAVLDPNSVSSAEDVIAIRNNINQFLSVNAETCSKVKEQIAFSETIQTLTNRYVEKKVLQSPFDSSTRNIARVYDDAYTVYEPVSDKSSKADLLTRVGLYFDSFGKIALKKSANLDVVLKTINDNKNLNSTKLIALAMGGLLDSSVIGEAFQAIQSGTPTSQDFERGLYWINSLASQCTSDLYFEPTGKDCSLKLKSKEFIWLEFSRQGEEFQFLVIQ